MKSLQHNVFIESAVYPIWSWNATARRERNPERVRQRAEDFIDEIGVDNVVSVTEHAPTFGPFSVAMIAAMRCAENREFDCWKR